MDKDIQPDSVQPKSRFEKKLPVSKSFRRKMLALPFIILLGSILAWVVYINFPRADFPVSEISDTQSTTSRAVDGNSDSDTSTQSELSFQTSVIYSPGYLIDLGGIEKIHPFDIRKYKKIHRALIEDGLLTEETTHKPAPLTRDDLLLVHTEDYLERLKSRKNIAKYLESNALQFVPISLDKAVLEPFRRASGGTLLAARHALRTGIGINIGGGYHHAKPDIGEGFCLYADVPIAIRKLQSEDLIQRAIVIDVDVHQGNGTIVCLDDDETTFTFSMHQGDIYPVPKEDGDRDVELTAGMQDERYLEILAENLPEILEQANADICFIVGGCDTLNGDPLASLRMTPGGIVNRDYAIVAACKRRNLPVVLTLSGGYSPNAWKSQYMSIKNLVETYGLAENQTAEPQK